MFASSVGSCVGTLDAGAQTRIRNIPLCSPLKGELQPLDYLTQKNHRFALPFQHKDVINREGLHSKTNPLI